MDLTNLLVTIALMDERLSDVLAYLWRDPNPRTLPLWTSLPSESASDVSKERRPADAMISPVQPFGRFLARIRILLIMQGRLPFRAINMAGRPKHRS
jgi:hypothetical protein